MEPDEWRRKFRLISVRYPSTVFFFFNDTATTEIYTLSLHDALPIYYATSIHCNGRIKTTCNAGIIIRSEEHTSELQSRLHLVCRLLLEKKNTNICVVSRLGPQPDTQPTSVIMSPG